MLTFSVYEHVIRTRCIRSSEKAIRMVTMPVKYTVIERNSGNFKDKMLLITLLGYCSSFYCLIF